MEETTGWRPEPGETISGKVVDLSRGWSDWQNEFYPIVTLRTDSNELVNVHAFHSVLRNRLMDKEPKVGHKLAITFHGKRDTKDGKRSVNVYTVEAPDSQQNAHTFWQGLGATHPERTAVQEEAQGRLVEPEIPPDTEDIPF